MASRIIVRIELTPSAKDALNSLTDKAGMTQVALLSRLVEWFAIPGLMKITVIQKPATKAHMGINPFTKMEQMFKAKPARRVVKVRPLRALKDMVK
jgi:hypothetical protein